MEDATYSTKVLFERKEAEQLKLKAKIFVNKIQQVIQNFGNYY